MIDLDDIRQDIFDIKTVPKVLYVYRGDTFELDLDLTISSSELNSVVLNCDGLPEATPLTLLETTTVSSKWHLVLNKTQTLILAPKTHNFTITIVRTDGTELTLYKGIIAANNRVHSNYSNNYYISSLLKQTAPTISDNNYLIGTMWVNVLTNRVYFLTSVVNDEANWIDYSVHVDATIENEKKLSTNAFNDVPELTFENEVLYQERKRGWEAISEVPVYLRKDEIGTNRIQGSAIVGDEIFWIGGTSVTIVSSREPRLAGASNKNISYNLRTNTWKENPDLPVRKDSPTLVAVGTDIYILGSYGRTNKFYPYNSVFTPDYKYDTITNTYEEISSLQDENYLYVSVQSSGADHLDGKIYISGRYWDRKEKSTSSESVAITEAKLAIYDIATDTWTLGPTPPMLNDGGSSKILDRKFYVYRNTFHYYDIDAETWSEPLNVSGIESRSHTSMTVRNGRIYVIGGFISGSSPSRTSGKTYVYDPTLNEWEEDVDLLLNNDYGIGIGYSMSVVWNDRFVVFGGTGIDESKYNHKTNVENEFPNWYVFIERFKNEKDLTIILNKAKEYTYSKAEIDNKDTAIMQAIEADLEEKADKLDTLTYKGSIDTWDNWFALEDGLYTFDEDGVSDTLGHGPAGNQDTAWSSLIKYQGLYGYQVIAFTIYNREMWTCGVQEGDTTWRKVSYSDEALDFKGVLNTWDGWRNLPVGMYQFTSGVIPYTTDGPNVEREIVPGVNEREASKERNWSSLLITEGVTGKNAIAMSAGNKETWTCVVNGSTETWERLTKARDTLTYRGRLTAWPETLGVLPVGMYSLSDSIPQASGMPPQLGEYEGYGSLMVVPAALGVDIYLTGLYSKEMWLMQEREGEGEWQRILPRQQVGGTDYQSASSWAKVAEVAVPLGSFQRQSITFLVTSENTTSTAAERYAGILELNTHETPASSILRWLVVSGFGLSNFNLRLDGNMLSIWVLPTIKGISFTLLASTAAGSLRDNVRLFRQYSGETRTGSSLGNSEKANIQDIADILTGATSNATELRIANRSIKQVNPGVEDTDAVNVNQLNTAIGNLEVTIGNIGDILDSILGV